MNRLRRTFGQLGIRRGDIFVFAVLLAGSLVLGILFALRQPEAEYVSVRVDGVETARLSLHTDCVYQISAGNTIEIYGGSVRMIHADCPDKICMKTGSVSQIGHSIVCAPNRVVVLITGGSHDRDGNAYDAVAN